MKHLKIFEEFKAGNLYVMDEDITQIEVDGFPVKIVNREDVSGLKSIYNIITVSKGVAQLGIRCFSKLDDAKNHISRLINIYQNPPNGDEPVEVGSFIITKTILDLVDVKSEEDGETPPKWVKNPKSWAMDKIVSLLTPESNINQIATTYVESGVFSFKELNKLKSNIKAIYQSSKDKKEADVTDHCRRFGIKSNIGAHQWKGNKDKIDLAIKFENLLRYFQK